MASIVETVFERYRNRNRKAAPVVQQTTIEQQQQDKFGPDALQKNPNIELFDRVKNSVQDAIDRRSVITQYQTGSQLDSPERYFQSLFDGMLALPVMTNKQERIRQYRAMAQYTECDFCINELADDFLHEDDERHFMRLNIPESKTHLNEDMRSIINTEFERFIDLFQFKDEGFDYVRKFIIEGEVAFENIINVDDTSRGIIGVKYIPTDYYETIVDPDNGKPIGITFDKEKLMKDMRNLISNSCLGSRTIFNNMIQTQADIGFHREDQIPILWPQLTYISSGHTSPDGYIIFPLIEKCKQAYHQLALMQDAAVILRVTRAPERLLFNISTGNMADKVSRQKIQQFIHDMKSRKILTGTPSGQDGHGNQEITQVYDPPTMLETYFFSKTNANDGTTVESVTSTADYEQIADIEFFLRRLFKQFKVPFSRYKTPENSLERDDTISYEEYSMARMLIRIQRRFAVAIKRSFITDLKLRGMWKTYQIKESDFDVDFTTPVLYDLYQTQKLVTAKMDTYKAIVDQEELSKIDAMKRILGMTDEQVDQNFKNLIKEKQLVALADYYADKISDDNKPLDFKSPLRLSGDEGNGGNGGGTGEDNQGEQAGGETGEEQNGGEGGEENSAGEPEAPQAQTNDEGKGQVFGLG